MFERTTHSIQSMKPSEAGVRTVNSSAGRAALQADTPAKVCSYRLNGAGRLSD
ncbi:MAG: hypothetical protein JWO56_3242 [Acidobacteria bacterium]|nr:hypothetical protein [Acidobacteriota bacterium]